MSISHTHHPVSPGDGNPQLTPGSSTPGSARSALELDGISMHFDGRRVLRDVSLRFEPGVIHGLVGHNGSGKSTLIRIAAGYYRPSGGSISLGGEPITLGSPQTCYQLGLRFVHQELGLIPQFTALENFGLGAGYSRTWRRTVSWTEQRRRLHAALRLLQTDLPDDRPVEQFSAVERALLAIARAIAPGTGGEAARFLMLDEPTTALEGPETEHLFQVVRRLADQGVGVLYVSHQLDDVGDLTNVITVLRDGQLVETLSSAGATHEQIVRAMLGADAPPAQQHEPRPDRTRSAKPEGDPVLSIRGLTSPRLKGADLTVGRGECVGAVGLSGSGREELVYAIAGAIPATARSIQVRGRTMTSLKPSDCQRHRIALVPGNRLPGSIVKNFTIEENLSFASLAGITGPAGLVRPGSERRLASTWIAEFGILPAEPGYQCRHLSGGNKQKVILGKWLATDPVMLLIDEPTAGVDVGAAGKMLQTLRSLADGGMSLLMTTSEVSDVLSIADRVLVFSRGHLVCTLTRDADEWSEEAILHAMTGARAAEDEPSDYQHESKVRKS